MAYHQAILLNSFCVKDLVLSSSQKSDVRSKADTFFSIAISGTVIEPFTLFFNISCYRTTALILSFLHVGMREAMYFTFLEKHAY